ncbi:hypothetical protein CJI59_19400 [Streptomyces sp. Alain-F2R5]|nr:hypothetical protein CJI59_19400 [Streptomyces sp. Alain-F2R5]
MPQVTRPQDGGRRHAGDREALDAIIHVVASGCTWRRLPPVSGPASPTACRRLTRRDEDRVWAGLCRPTRAATTTACAAVRLRPGERPTDATTRQAPGRL